MFYYHDIDPELGSDRIKHRANYLNAERAIGVDGKSYAIVFDKNPGSWGHPEEELEKQKAIESVRLALGVDRMHLIDDGGFFLDGEGAVACTYKGEYE